MPNNHQNKTRDPQEYLPSLPLADRIEAIAQGLSSKQYEFKDISPEELAEIIGVNTECADGSWGYPEVSDEDAEAGHYGFPKRVSTSVYSKTRIEICFEAEVGEGIGRPYDFTGPYSYI